jgi:hypothetical protein
MGAALGSVLNSVSSTLTDIIDATDWSGGVVEGFRSIAGTIGQIIKSALISAMMSSANTLLAVLRQAASVLAPAMMAAANLLLEGLRKAAIAFGPLLAGIMKAVTNGLFGMVRGLIDVIGSVIEPMTRMWGPIGDSAKAAANAISNASKGLLNAAKNFNPAKSIEAFGKDTTPIFSAEAIKEQNDRTQKLINDLTKNDRQASIQQERAYRRNRELKLSSRRDAQEKEEGFVAEIAKPWWQVQGKTGEFSAALESEVQRRREALAIGPEKPKTTAELMGQPSPRELFSGATKVKAAPQKSGFATMAESIAWISGRTVNDLLLEQNVKQTDVQQQMKDALDRIEKNTSNPKPVKVEIPQGAVFARP